MAVKPKLTTDQKQQINQIIQALRNHEWRARYETLAFDPERVKGGLPPKPELMYFYLLIGEMHLKGSQFEAVMMDLRKQYHTCSRCVEFHQPSLVRRTGIQFACTTREYCTFRQLMDDERVLYRRNGDYLTPYPHWRGKHVEIGASLLDALI